MIGTLPSAGLEPAETAEGVSWATAVKALIRHGLSPVERLVLILHYHEGLTADETSAVLGLPTDEVARTRQTLRARLQTQLTHGQATREGWGDVTMTDPQKN